MAHVAGNFFVLGQAYKEVWANQYYTLRLALDCLYVNIETAHTLDSIYTLKYIIHRGRNASVYSNIQWIVQIQQVEQR